jgi:hypothetical protein
MSRLPADLRKFDRISAEKVAFSKWFAETWERQVGPPVDGRRRLHLDERAFLKAMSACMKRLEAVGVAPDPRTLDNWRKGTSVPRESFVEPLLDTLLGDDAERERGHELWRAAENAKNQSSTEKRRPQIIDDTPGESDWRAENAEPLQVGLAELLVHPPPRGGNTPLEFPLQISLSFAECPDELEDATLALTDATLIPTWQGCRPMPGSRLGEGENVHPHLKSGGGAWRIAGPTLGNNHLQGEPLGSDALCIIQCDGEPEDSLTLTLRSGKRALVVMPEQPDADAATVKQRILQAFLQKCLPSDREGIVTWGRATLRRKPSK